MAEKKPAIRTETLPDSRNISSIARVRAKKKRLSQAQTT